MFRPGRRDRKAFVRAAKIIGRGILRITRRKRLQNTSSGQLAGSVKGRPRR